MTDQLQRLQQWLVAGEKTTRRKFLVRAGKVGVGVFAALIGSSNVLAVMVQCCNLSWWPDQCPNNACPSECSCYVWICCQGAQRYFCGECNNPPPQQARCSYYGKAGTCPQLGP